MQSWLSNRYLLLQSLANPKPQSLTVVICRSMNRQFHIQLGFLPRFLPLLSCIYGTGHVLSRWTLFNESPRTWPGRGLFWKLRSRNWTDSRDRREGRDRGERELRLAAITPRGREIVRVRMESVVNRMGRGILANLITFFSEFKLYTLLMYGRL